MRILCCVLAAALLPSGADAAFQAKSEPIAATNADRPTAAEAMAFIRAYSPTDVRREGELSMLRKNFVPGLRRDPKIGALIDAYPDLGPALVAAMESQIDVYMREFDETFFPRAAAIARDALSRQDVLALTAFYQSPLGRKALRTMALNLDGSEVVERALANENVDDALAKRQVERSAFATLVQLTAEDREQIIALTQRPEGKHLTAAAPAFRALQIELMNKPGPKFTAGVTAAMEAAFKRVTKIDPAAAK